MKLDKGVIEGMGLGLVGGFETGLSHAHES
jgi:hypothetical protein